MMVVSCTQTFWFGISGIKIYCYRKNSGLSCEVAITKVTVEQGLTVVILL